MIVWLDCQVAAAGDMILAALVDAGADLDVIQAGLDTIGLDVRLRKEQVTRGALRALRIHGGYEEPGGPDDGWQVPTGRRRGGPGRPWRVVRGLIEGAPWPDRVRTRALAAYRRLAEAEARLHGMPVDEVTLHEVGSDDAIADIVGVCLALEDLGVTRVVATALPVGTGSIVAAHGRLPLPAPATLEVLAGWPVVPAAHPGEWVTPTGATLITSLAAPGGPPAMTVAATGYGAGKKDPAFTTNVVRAVLGREAPATPTEPVTELTCQIDDLPGTLAGPVLSGLLERGALDAWWAPIVMKKGRPAHALHALTRPDDAERIATWILRNTTTLGVRRRDVARWALDRSFSTVETPFGPITMKAAGRDGEVWRAAPETEDMLAAAARAGVPATEVDAAARAAWKASNNR